MRVVSGDGKRPRVRRRKSAVRGRPHRRRRQIATPRTERNIEEPLEKPIARSTQTQIDDFGLLVDRELQRFRQRETVAHGRRRSLRAPASTARSAISRDSGAMPATPWPLSARAAMIPATAVPCTSATLVARVDEIARHGHLSGQIGMIDLDARVDFRHANLPPGRDLVDLVQMPELGARLQRVERIVMAKNAEQIHRLDRLHPRVGRHLFHERRERSVAGASMTKQSTPSAGIGQLSMIFRPYWRASASAIRRRASRPTPVS